MGGGNGALVTNLPLLEQEQRLFDEENIEVIIVPFDKFKMPDNYIWRNAFYKLCALDHMVRERDFEKILMLDADTITVASYKDIWDELDYGLMLHHCGSRFSNDVRKAMRSDYRKLSGCDMNVMQYGGEFIGGNRKNLINFVRKLTEIYGLIVSHSFMISEKSGDEAIISVALSDICVLDASPYMERFYTRGYYLASNKWENNELVVWHLINEKNIGIELIYRYYRKHKQFPAISKMAKWCNLPKRKSRFSLSWLLMFILGHLDSVE